MVSDHDDDDNPDNNADDANDPESNKRERDNAASQGMPGKRRRVITSARWETAALRKFRRIFEGQSESSEQGRRARRQGEREHTDEDANTPGSGGGSSGVTRDDENDCTRIGVT